MTRTPTPTQAEFYRTQARTMREQAADTVLTNVQDRCLRSAEAWTSMAERAERGELNRARTKALKEAVVHQPPSS